jgi:hypothetical protein
MSSGVVSNGIREYLAGNLACQRAIHELRQGSSDVDFLYHVARDAYPQFASDYLRGFMRNLQKAIEREVQHG